MRLRIGFILKRILFIVFYLCHLFFKWVGKNKIIFSFGERNVGILLAFFLISDIINICNA